MIKPKKSGTYLEQNRNLLLGKEIRFLEESEPTLINLPAEYSPDFISPKEIIAIAEAANIIDEFDGKLLSDKLKEATKNYCTQLIVDVIDDEPYLSAQTAVFKHLYEDLKAGIVLAARAVGIKNVEIQIYEEYAPNKVTLPSELKVKVKRVEGIYPTEYQPVHAENSKHTIAIGACALYYLYRAVYFLEKQTDAIITIAGDCIANPGNYRIPIGTTVSEVLLRTGTIADPKLLIAGGSMTGLAITDPTQHKILPTTEAVLAFDTTYKDFGHVCIGCGRCSDVCPEGLSPYYIYSAMMTSNKKLLEISDSDLCTACGTCSYVCPAKLDLAHIVSISANVVRRGKK